MTADDPAVDVPAVRLVLAEDEAIIRMDLREVLEDDGYEVVAECANGRDAVRLVREHRPDAAIFDVKMPELDGIEAARELSSDRICPIVLLTAFSQRQLISEATEAGVMAYLVKPFQRQDLVPALEVAIGRFAELAGATSAAADAEERLRARKLLDRAKARLIESNSMSEDEAFKFIQRSAMDRRESIAAVSEQVIDGTLQP